MDKKAKVGILTYHRSKNYGAFMQAYSLSERLGRELTDCEVQVVDYMSKETYCLYKKDFLSSCYLILKAKTFRRKLTYIRHSLTILKGRLQKKSDDVSINYFEEAIHKLPLSSPQIITDNITEIADYLNHNFDILIVGSDAVWNWQIKPFPNAYMLGDHITCKKVSYAASSYGQPYKDISDAERVYLANAWNSYQYIGVRDEFTEAFVHNISSNVNIKHNCDPTVFLDMDNIPYDKNVLESKLKAAGFDFTRISIGIMAAPWLASMIREIVGDRYQIVSVYNHSEYADVNLMNLNPFEWAKVFGYFDLTITHYFHGNLLSLKNCTPTIVVEKDSDYNSNYGSKIRDFMTRVNLLDNCVLVDGVTDKQRISDKIVSLLNDKSIKDKIKKDIDKEAMTIQSFIDDIKNIL